MKPEEARSGLAKAVSLALAVATVLVACDLTPDDRFVGAPGPPFFFVESSSLVPGTQHVPLNQPITLGFSRYLDPDSFEYFNALSLQSGGLSAPGFARYRLVDRSLTFFPTRDLRPELVYTLSINPETVRALAGGGLDFPFAITFQTAAGGVVPQERDVPVRSFATDVTALLAQSCSCHGDSPELPALSYDTLVGRASEQLPERLLVRPFDAPRSYLMHKILPGYPDRRFAEMPPPWSDAPRLEAADLEVIEDWINTGAAP